MKDIFIADAHLRDPNAPEYRHLIKFLTSEMGQIRNLVLLGDIFEFWVGYRHCVFSAYVPILEILHKLQAAGTKIVFVEGNHDFHMGPFFRDTLNATIFSDAGTVQLDGNSIYLCHGDTLAATPNYLRLRSFFRSGFAQLLIRLLPADTTWKIAEVLGNASRKRRQKQQPRQHHLPITKISHQAQIQFADGCTTFICGHFHQGWQQHHDGTHILVLGNWADTCHYGLFENGTFSLQQYKPPTSA